MPPRMLTYRWFAKMYGWTPPMVDEAITEDVLEWFPKIETAEARAAKIKEKQESGAPGKTSRHF